MLERRAVHVADLQAETEKFPEGSAIAQELGFRTILGVPLLREGAPRLFRSGGALEADSGRLGVLQQQTDACLRRLCPHHRDERLDGPHGHYLDFRKPPPRMVCGLTTEQYAVYRGAGTSPLLSG